MVTRLNCVLVLAAAFACALTARAQQKTYGWIPQGSDSYRMVSGAYNGVAVFNTQGYQALHIRLDIDAREPVGIGVVALDDWNNAVHNPELLHKLNYACLTEGVTRLNFSCDFFPSYTSRVVVVRDLRRVDRPSVAGVGAPLVRMAYNGFFSNEIRVTPFHWGCTAYCDLPDPPSYAWVDLRREKYQITSALKSYGPFTPQKDDDKIRIYVKSPFPMTVAMVPSDLVDQLYDNRDQAHEILSKTSCKQYGVQKSTFDCTLQMSDGPQQVVLLPEVEINKKKKAQVEISTVQCVANCPK
ncbi:MAG TPA: hypothetical protein VJN64_11505 [Terriglobales bacterium]|nr:hypothetical protein [Terriglobales bacterium]